MANGNEVVSPYAEKQFLQEFHRELSFYASKVICQLFFFLGSSYNSNIVCVISSGTKMLQKYPNISQRTCDFLPSYMRSGNAKDLIRFSGHPCLQTGNWRTIYLDIRFSLLLTINLLCNQHLWMFLLCYLAYMLFLVIITT